MGTDAEDKRKHLEFLQGVINRMASNSFLFKGWSITIIAGISAFAAKDSSSGLMIVPMVSSLLFWSIDAHYLMLERAFRDLYDDVATLPASAIDYSMKPKNVSVAAWAKTLVGRPILWLFYGTVLIMLVLLTFIINGYSLEVRFAHGT